MFKIPELLAPAGGMEQLKAAVENGADAVYMGGKLFNARINAANFTDEEIREAVTYAHLRGAKLYVTMNTLIKDRELEDALKYAKTLYEDGVDALIIQDLGFAELIRNHFPEWSLHLSTQGTIFNVEGVRAAKKLGFSRVVLARELTLEQIKEITALNLLEVEVFSHGALCVCYSGQCQMSREIGGRSGNRGECAQPCRLPYTVCSQKGGEVKELTEPYFALSPKDLCTIEQLGALAEARVTSLKIEGRMKTPEYVAIVTGIYRKYLDLYEKQGSYTVEPSDLHDLNQIFNRGSFTEGYLNRNPKKNLMSGDLSKHQGIYIGKVAKNSNTLRAENRQRGLVTIQLEQDLSVGDGIEIRNKELPGNLVTFMKQKDNKIALAGKGQIVTVGYIDGNMTAGDKVYKITDKSLMQKARASYEGKSGTTEKNLRKMGVCFQFSAGLELPITLKAEDEEGNIVTKELPERPERAINKALTSETIEAQLSKTGGTPFRLLDCKVELDDDISIPLSKINELRRLVLEELEAYKTTVKRRPVKINWSLSTINRKFSKGTESIIQDCEDHGKEEMCYYYHQVKHETNFDPNASRIYVPYDAVLDGRFQNDSRIVPVIPGITKGWHDQNIRINFNKIIAISGKNGIAIGNLAWVEPFVKCNVNVCGDYGLNLYNSMDFLLKGNFTLF